MNAVSRDYGGETLSRLQSLCDAGNAVFSEAGFTVIGPGTVLEAENLLDLYGEDVRARAFVFDIGGGKDLCLRPDLTLPICRHHLSTCGKDGKYIASGPVYRKPSEGEVRPVEFVQIGCEWFGADDPTEADARILCHVRDAVNAMGVTEFTIETGDLGVLFALIDAAQIPDRWRARLKRHVWRPSRFAALLKDYASIDAQDPGRHALLKALGSLGPDDARAAVERMLALSETTHVGLRSPEEIAARFLEQARDAKERPLSGDIVAAVETAAGLSATPDKALMQLRDLSAGAGIDITEALDRFEARLEHLQKSGFDLSSMRFDGEFGRNLEYYDGFVFELYVPGIASRHGRRAAQIAGGGRYDGLLNASAKAFGGNPVNSSAVGAAIRPETILSITEGAT